MGAPLSDSDLEAVFWVRRAGPLGWARGTWEICAQIAGWCGPWSVALTAATSAAGRFGAEV